MSSSRQYSIYVYYICYPLFSEDLKLRQVCPKTPTNSSEKKKTARRNSSGVHQAKGICPLMTAHPCMNPGVPKKQWL